MIAVRPSGAINAAARGALQAQLCVVGTEEKPSSGAGAGEKDQPALRFLSGTQSLFARSLVDANAAEEDDLSKAVEEKRKRARY